MTLSEAKRRHFYRLRGLIRVDPLEAVGVPAQYRDAPWIALKFGVTASFQITLEGVRETLSFEGKPADVFVAWADMHPKVRLL